MSLLVDDRFGALSQGDHVCAVYSDPSEQARAMVRYIHTGIDSNERCVYISDDRNGDEIRGRLRADGVDVGAASAGGRLLLLTKRESYLRDGDFAPAAMVDFLRLSEQAALGDGRSGLRVTGEMTWALGTGIGCDRVIEYEIALNEFFPGSRSHAICQYNRSRFDPSVIRDVLRTHPIAIIGQQVCPNPFYEPPHLARGQGSVEAHVEWMIEQLVRLRENELKLHEAVAARDEFLTAAAHELRNPLHALNLAIEAFAASGADPGHVNRLTRQVQRLTRLVDATLDVSRLHDRRRSLQPAPCDLRAIVHEVATRLLPEAVLSGSTIRENVPPIVGHWDHQALEQILSNLIGNALKYAPGEPVVIEAARVGDRALLKVHDRGIGVRSDFRERTLERFHRGGPMRTYSGIGLGLWIVREYVQALGGEVVIDDAAVGGAVITLSLPLSHPAEHRH